MKKIIPFVTVLLLNALLTVAQIDENKISSLDREKQIKINGSLNNGYFSWTGSEIPDVSRSISMLERIRGYYTTVSVVKDTLTNSYRNNQTSNIQISLNNSKEDVVDKNGQVIGYRQADDFEKDKVNVFNINGALIGYCKTDSLNKEWKYIRYK